MNCEGCGGGEVIGRFHIRHGYRDCGYFYYCPKCVELNKERGFDVISEEEENEEKTEG